VLERRRLCNWRRPAATRKCDNRADPNLFTVSCNRMGRLISPLRAPKDDYMSRQAQLMHPILPTDTGWRASLLWSSDARRSSLIPEAVALFVA